ncbi:hypothetical protein COY26_05195 [Candidatus Woesearchaeota archaeon CG_4_10_14_0_2_um_filter_33_10]|nr:MAG: hypothetical protein AUJ83_02170 [Candidatus Woesearchaeota archaeon CG1_02_33_12]PIN78840.1 MAG: hypothetical protein COV14_01820 [Candidatus Woesearchaeota archaeon CG10_big_fil_rev_8_21_14_0_10_33_12]PIU72074.1 MAG: hypothetical protein COS79_04730 [Candidatus Woesearchaeota archaeon CG06_land_8_20_14_3_00_33_13]PIZ51998.1 MAG: hypothetical protein COY26_05195 [Candidatus Woesearchaeota archaeon CG_4_10_14_0_2_um_filter_33_10]
MVKRIKTGIPGLDKVMEGGLVDNSVNLLSGGTGTGKSIFSLQFLFNGAKQFNEKGLYISLEEPEESLKADVEKLGMDFKKVSKNVKFMYMPPYGITNFLDPLREQIEKFKPDRIVIDSLTALVMPLEDDFERKKEIVNIIKLLKRLKCTSILVSEIPSNGNIDSDSVGGFSRFGIEEFLCDSLIILHYAGIGGESDRAIRIIKMRQTNHVRGPIPMSIGKSGISVLKTKY